MACLGIIFYVAGHLLVTRLDHQSMQIWGNELRVIIILIAIVFTVLVILGSSINGSISFGHSDIQNLWITYPCAFMGIYMMLQVSMLLTEKKLAKKICGSYTG